MQSILNPQKGNKGYPDVALEEKIAKNNEKCVLHITHLYHLLITIAQLRKYATINH